VTSAEVTAEAIQVELAKVIVGQEEAIEALVVALLAGGHVLLEGVPGTAKTLMVRALAETTGGTFKRIQFTPDLMPSDITGTNVFNAGQSTFALKKGPVFANFVLADEVNRAPAKTQSALLQAMEEHQVTIDGQDLDLPSPFIVFATQNPVEYEGTYLLPEAQLDRFMVKVTIGYPEEDEEKEILSRWDRGFDPNDLAGAGLKRVVELEDVFRLRQSLPSMKASDELLGYITSIIRSTRHHRDLILGASPRAAVNLLLATKARAALQLRNFVTPDDVKALAPACLRHRLILNPDREIEGRTADDVVQEILAHVPVPRQVDEGGAEA